MTTIDPHAADQAARTRTAREVADLFATLATQRPEVLDALRALLVALTAPPAAAVSLDGASDALPSPPIENGIGATVPPQPELPARPSGVVEVRPAPTADADLHAQQHTKRPERRSEPYVQNQKDLAGLESLLGKFGVKAPLGEGLGKPSDRLVQSDPEGRWDSYARTARDLARLARTQAKRVRSLRRARHEQRELPPTDGILADRLIEDWTSDSRLVARLEPKHFREGERWYSHTSQALQEVAEWLESNPQQELGAGRTPQALADRLACLAIAQKGIFCWITRTLGTGSRCGVQETVFGNLRAWIHLDCFAVYLDFGMQLRQEVTSEERELVARDLTRFEMEHATDDADDVAQPPAQADRPGSARAVSHAAPQAERFDSVAEAFEAAQEKFGRDGMIVFTERAEQSAGGSAFKRPDDVYEFFESLHGIAWRLRENDDAGQPLDALFLQRGFRKKPCAPSTMRRLRRFYHMPFEGKEVDLSQHVTLGSRNQNTCLSIHWWHDKDRGRFVIGHCGKHLPNSLT